MSSDRVAVEEEGAELAALRKAKRHKLTLAELQDEAPDAVWTAMPEQDTQQQALAERTAGKLTNFRCLRFLDIF
jgi:hypothetical protein